MQRERSAVGLNVARYGAALRAFGMPYLCLGIVFSDQSSATLFGIERRPAVVVRRRHSGYCGAAVSVSK